MATTREDLRNWLEKELGNDHITHMIVVCDTFSYEDYPVYVCSHQDVREVKRRYSKDMQEVMEVYSYNHDLESQLNEPRAFHYD